MNLYIFYKDKDGKNKLKQFEKESEALKFILSERIDIALCEVFEVKKVLEFGFISKDDSIKKEELKCIDCGGTISSSAYTGRCHSCSSKSKMGERLCENCGKTKIANWNKTGLCGRCRSKYGNQERNQKRKEKKPHDEIEVKKKPEKIEQENEQEIKKQKNNTIGKCRKCTKGFKLENWQHSSMHWCPECRKSPNYKDYVE